MHIRSYQAADRSSVRRICCDTADRGEPVERFFTDRELFADLVTRYYTDAEPQSLWVAEHEGRVIGYLTGCLEPRRYQWVMGCRILPAALMKAIRRRTWQSPQTWRILWGGWRTWHRGGPPWAVLRRYPAHLHVNIELPFRDQRVGQRLVERFLEQARTVRVSGAHVAVRSDNPRACRFFERMGFTEFARVSVVFPQGDSYHVHDTVFYGRRL